MHILPGAVAKIGGDEVACLFKVARVDDALAGSLSGGKDKKSTWRDLVRIQRIQKGELPFCFKVKLQAHSICLWMVIRFQGNLATVTHPNDIEKF